MYPDRRSWYICAIVPWSGYITARDQSMVELSGVRWSTEGEKNTASKTPPGFGDDYNKSPQRKHEDLTGLKLKSNSFQSYPWRETAASGGKRCG